MARSSVLTLCAIAPDLSATYNGAKRPRPMLEAFASLLKVDVAKIAKAAEKQDPDAPVAEVAAKKASPKKAVKKPTKKAAPSRRVKAKA